MTRRKRQKRRHRAGGKCHQKGRGVSGLYIMRKNQKGTGIGSRYILETLKRAMEREKI